MQLQEPHWLIGCLIPILLIVAAIFTRKGHKKNLKAFVSSPRLASRLIRQSSSRLWWASTICLAVACILTIVALCTPTNGQENIELPSKGRRIYLAMDLSRSMLVKDISPDRLTVAKTAALEILEAFPQEKIGLISFAGSAWLEAPLTTDHVALRESILAMNENTIPYGGTSAAPLFEVAANTVPEDTSEEALLILLSDGEFHNEPPKKEIFKATEKGFRIFTLGFGTVDGDYVPDKNSFDGLFHDNDEQTVLSTLKTEPLEKIALLGNGQYFDGDDYSFVSRLKKTISNMQGNQSETRDIVIHKHIYSYFLIPAMILLFLTALLPKLGKPFRGISSLILLTLLLPIPKAHSAQESSQPKNEINYTQPPDAEIADLISSTSKTKSEEKLARLKQESNRLEELIKNAKGENVKRYSFSKGVTDYERAYYNNAIESFSKSLLSKSRKLQKEAHYNIGNSLYKQGEQLLPEVEKLKKQEEKMKLMDAVITQWQDALEHYTGTLHLDQEHPTAKDNYEFVKNKLEELKEQQKQESEKAQGEGEGKGNNDGQGQKGDEGLTWDEIKEKMKEAGNEGNKPKPSEAKEEKEEDGSGSNEQNEALERRPGETGKELAERKLREGSDAESGQLKTGRQKFFRSPSKDW